MPVAGARLCREKLRSRHGWAMAPARDEVKGMPHRGCWCRSGRPHAQGLARGNPYPTTACRAGWREFVTLTALFDCDAGFLVNDTVVFSADVLVLRESSEARSVRSRCGQACASWRKGGDD